MLAMWYRKLKAFAVGAVSWAALGEDMVIQ